MNNLVLLTVNNLVKILEKQNRLEPPLGSVILPGRLAEVVSLPVQLIKAGVISVDPFEIAATYVYGIRKIEPFSTGNVKLSILAALVFLAVNDIKLTASSEKLVDASVKADDHAEFVLFLRDHSEITVSR